MEKQQNNSKINKKDQKAKLLAKKLKENLLRRKLQDARDDKNKKYFEKLEKKTWKIFFYVNNVKIKTNF